MPITEYKIIVGTTVEELTEGVVGAGCVPVGDLDPSTADYAMQAAGVGTVDIGTVSEYQVVLGETPLLLQNAVNEKIKEGLQPVGGVFHWQRGFLQAVGKIDASGSGGGSGSGGDLPSGSQYDVITYGVDKKASASPLSLSTWIRGELPVSAGGEELIPVTMTAPNNGSPALQAYRALGASPEPDSVMMRDAYGKTQVAYGTSDFDAVNLKQAQEMIETSKQWLIDNIYDIINNGVGKR